MEYKKWGTIDYHDSEFYEEWNFYGAAKWLIKKYFRQAIKLEEEYNRGDLIDRIEDLRDWVDQDLLEKTNILALIYTPLDNTNLDEILYLLSEGISKGEFSSDDLRNHPYKIARFFIRGELRNILESEMWILFRKSEVVLGKEILDFFE